MKDFDYIIVGAGSAGCVLANRLSADPACRVLLLEAGGPGANPAIDTPAWYGQLQDSACDWGYRTVPQTQLYGRRIFLPQGRVVGGSSAINYMIYMRGNRGDYDQWQALGNPGWDYASVLPYFIKAENNLSIRDGFHGNSGPLVVTSHPDHPLVTRYFAAAEEIGLPFNPDFNGASQEGAGPMQATIQAGRRCSAAAAYLEPVRGRPNLTVRPHALATRLLCRGERVTGVDYFRLGRQESATASAEVLVAAGAIRSPQLLLLSGIGAAAELEALGITPRLDLPGVGKNLQDHLHSRVRCEITAPLTYAPFVEEQRRQALERYQTRGDGPLASNFLEAGAFVKSRPEERWPDLQLFFLMTLAPDYPEAGNSRQHGITLTAYINRPQSRGEIRLASPDPLDRPLIDFNYLSRDADLACALAGVRWNLQLLYAKAFDPIRGREVAPGSKLRSDTQLADFIRRTASTTWHPGGTCKMGQDPLAVVDSTLKVHGTANLRVVDASIMPTLVSGNTNAPVIMIAEKAAALIAHGE